MVLLKAGLPDALRDGNRIFAVVWHVPIRTARFLETLTMPSEDAQVATCTVRRWWRQRRAARNGRCGRRGTGVSGDPIEYSLARVYGAGTTALDRRQRCSAASAGPSG